MKKEIDDLECGRENNLMAFLYGELDSTEKSSFHRHMQDCAGCQAQLSSFTYIRESVVAWRNESLEFVTLPLAQRSVARVDRESPSALAALREFFNLSPLWMKGTVAFASLLFCLLAVLAVARWNEPSPEMVVDASNQAQSEAFNVQVERRVQQELQRRQGLERVTPPVVSANPPAQSSTPANRSKQVASANQQRKAGRPLSKTEREELAADLRLIANDDDAELNLIGDRINQ